MAQSTDGDFVRVTTAFKQQQVINIRQIVSVCQHGADWQVRLTNGDPVLLHKGEAEVLFARLPGAETSQTAPQ